MVYLLANFFQINIFLFCSLLVPESGWLRSILEDMTQMTCTFSTADFSPDQLGPLDDQKQIATN